MPLPSAGPGATAGPTCAHDANGHIWVSLIHTGGATVHGAGGAPGTHVAGTALELAARSAARTHVAAAHTTEGRACVGAADGAGKGVARTAKRKGGRKEEEKGGARLITAVAHELQEARGRQQKRYETHARFRYRDTTRHARAPRGDPRGRTERPKAGSNQKNGERTHTQTCVAPHAVQARRAGAAVGQRGALRGAGGHKGHGLGRGRRRQRGAGGVHDREAHRRHHEHACGAGRGARGRRTKHRALWPTKKVVGPGPGAGWEWGQPHVIRRAQRRRQGRGGGVDAARAWPHHAQIDRGW